MIALEYYKICHKGLDPPKGLEIGETSTVKIRRNWPLSILPLSDNFIFLVNQFSPNLTFSSSFIFKKNIYCSFLENKQNEKVRKYRKGLNNCLSHVLSLIPDHKVQVN